MLRLQKQGPNIYHDTHVNFIALLGGGEESVFPTLEYRRSTGFWLLGSTPAERKSISTVATRMV